MAGLKGDDQVNGELYVKVMEKAVEKVRGERAVKPELPVCMSKEYWGDPASRPSLFVCVAWGGGCMHIS